MSGSARLDPLQAPLDGISLIEANAGTGKTWTITALYLRLLLETDRRVDSILVVTFTEIATAELRDRIRNRIVAARAAFERAKNRLPGALTDRDGSTDALVAGLLARISDHDSAALKLTSALRDFDQAPVYTIHAFCQRVLADRAFESGMPFESEILPDLSRLLQEITEDFWRRSLYDASPLFARCVLETKLTPHKLREELDGRLGKPYLEIRGPASPGDIPAIEAAYERAHAAARAIWRDSRQAISGQLVGNPNLHGNKYRAEWLGKWLEEMDRCLGRAQPGLSLFERFDKFTPDALAEGTKRGAKPPSHPFYAACAALKDAHAALEAAYECRFTQLRVELLEYSNAELAARKQRLRLQSYDDLLLNLEGALRAERGAELAAAIRGRYTAALIDEFQDTDPVQYRIFRAIYTDTGLPVFLVGDPKQSIYSFRGADIYAYLDARGDARHRHALDVNWRSDRPLLAAVNDLFERSAAPFVIPEISFVPSAPAPGSRGHLVVEGESAPPFEFQLIAGENGKPLNKDVATAHAAETTAAEIARLLRLGDANRARIAVPRNGMLQERALCGGDVAVLVRNHRQARAMSEALRRLGMASVERGAANVFATHEAEELQRVLMAVAEPGREPLVRAALATELIGYSGTALHALAADETVWEAVAERFRAAHSEWHEQGFIRMARRLLHDYGTVERLLGYPDGERRVTNLSHVLELMHRDTARDGMGAALEWLAGKRSLPGNKNEEELLRLESDENLVKILTVHAAKGLEFPLVFCPFMWDGRLHAAWDDSITFHDPAKRCAAVLDLGSATLEASRPLAVREELAEDLRLLYVALTRARYRCWMVWGHINEAETSAPAWLLHRREKHADSVAVTLSDARIRDDLERIAASAEGRIAVRTILPGEEINATPGATSPPQLAARAFTGAVRETWRLTSFSALAHARSVETPDYDAATRIGEIDIAVEARDIHAFPRGARTGRCLHAIFEAIDFADPNRAVLERVVARALAAHDFSLQWVGSVSDMVERALAAPLDETGTLRLGRIAADRRLNELEFYYPVAHLSEGGLKALLLRWEFPAEIRERIGTLHFAPARGYMKGYIDLVFECDGRYYLADYKSNWLGPSAGAYGQTELRKAMAREAYYLQYLVYCIALHRYLSARIEGYDYGRHFGGVYYLFLRGMRPDTGDRNGIYADRPERGLIEALDRYLAQG
ncbi:MAG: exodeoxyribonuclease V subunit beta [Betaproteobacteria bacterium]